jgi:hypothetical protein
MHNNSLFWGAILVLLGGIILLSNLGILPANIWGVFWPALMILFGVWIVWGAVFRRNPLVEQRMIPIEGAARARVKISHGAGRLSLGAGASEGALAEGEFGGGLDLSARHSGESLDVEMRPQIRSWGPWTWSPGALDWRIVFNSAVSLALDLETGAGENSLDLTELQVSGVRLNTGASATEIRLPVESGHTQVEVHSGASSIKIFVPDRVAARIHFRGGLSSLNVDTARFPRAGEYYQSSDYDTAVNRVDMLLEAGVGAVEVR